MTNRVTEKDLQSRIDLLNKLTGNPMKPSSNGKWNPGNYHLDSAYGGHGLRRMGKEGGSTKIIGGFYPKKKLMELLNAYISGIEDNPK